MNDGIDGSKNHDRKTPKRASPSPNPSPPHLSDRTIPASASRPSPGRQQESEERKLGVCHHHLRPGRFHHPHPSISWRAGSFLVLVQTIRSLRGESAAAAYRCRWASMPSDDLEVMHLIRCPKRPNREASKPRASQSSFPCPLGMQDANDLSHPLPPSNALLSAPFAPRSLFLWPCGRPRVVSRRRLIRTGRPCVCGDRSACHVVRNLSMGTIPEPERASSEILGDPRE